MKNRWRCKDGWLVEAVKSVNAVKNFILTHVKHAILKSKTL